MFGPIGEVDVHEKGICVKVGVGSGVIRCCGVMARVPTSAMPNGIFIPKLRLTLTRCCNIPVKHRQNVAMKVTGCPSYTCWSHLAKCSL